MKRQLLCPLLAVVVLASAMVPGLAVSAAHASLVGSSGAGHNDMVNSAAQRASILSRSTMPASAVRHRVLRDELAQARSILAEYVEEHPILEGATVEFGNARGYQAISYFQSGRIVISRNHTATLERIIGHEIWHIIDWRDNGRIDWGENVPPQ